MLEKTVLGLIETLYGAASDTKLWPVFLDGFGAAVSGNIVGFVVQDFQNSNAQLTLTNVDPSAIESYEKLLRQP